MTRVTVPRFGPAGAEKSQVCNDVSITVILACYSRITLSVSHATQSESLLAAVHVTSTE